MLVGEQKRGSVITNFHPNHTLHCDCGLPAAGAYDMGHEAVHSPADAPSQLDHRPPTGEHTVGVLIYQQRGDRQRRLGNWRATIVSVSHRHPRPNLKCDWEGSRSISTPGSQPDLQGDTFVHFRHRCPANIWTAHTDSGLGRKSRTTHR